MTSAGRAAPAPGARGHRGLPHTADLRLQAWAPTREECLAEAVAALVGSFADAAGRPAEWVAAAEIPPAGDAAVLVAVLEEVVYVVDTEGGVPVTTEVERTPDGRLRLQFGLVALDHVTLVGPAPKAVTMHGLRFGRDDPGWSCEVTVDV
ncbi:MAG TPA: archease [Pseudonocardia sp.]|nr:archease [Pseudonocardia sp.]